LQTTDLSGLIMALPLVFFALSGFEAACSISSHIENASVNFEVIYPGGEPITFQMRLTDAHGIATQRFAVNSQAPGIVTINITATFRTLQSHTKTSFQIWW